MTAILLPSLAQAQVEQILQDAIVRSSKVKVFSASIDVLHTDGYALTKSILQAKDLTGLQAEVLQTTLTGTGVSTLISADLDTLVCPQACLLAGPSDPHDHFLLSCLH